MTLSEDPVPLRRERMDSPFFDTQDTIFALATAQGRGAIAIVRCSGEDVEKKLAAAFSRPEALARARGYEAVYGHFQAPGNGERIDEVLLLKFLKPRSYSGENMLEIQCHNSPAVLKKIYEVLRELGMRPAQPGEFSYRSVKYGKRDLTQAEAAALLGQSISQNQRRHALQQMESPFFSEIRRQRSELLEILARTELQLDYDENELEFDYDITESRPIVEKTLDCLQQSLSTYRLQQVALSTYRIVLAGCPNSGKSSLFNYLLQNSRSIVSAQAGTTRDYLEAEFEIGGQLVKLYDTAGLHGNSPDPIEQEGIRRCWELLERAHIIIWVQDLAGPSHLSRPDTGLRKFAETHQIPMIEIGNKSDLIDGSRQDSLLQVSAHSGEGIPKLLSGIQTLLPKLPAEPSAMGPANERQAKLLGEAFSLLHEYNTQIPAGLSADLASELLRQACGRLGEMTGDITNREALREIFQNFCVGK